MRSLRGGITIEENSEKAIRQASLRLWDELAALNDLTPDLVESLIITCTVDIDAAYPGRFVRLERDLTKTSILHFNEMVVQGALPLCIRFLLSLKLPEERILTPVYLDEARSLRPDLYPDYSS